MLDEPDESHPLTRRQLRLDNQSAAPGADHSATDASVHFVAPQPVLGEPIEPILPVEPLEVIEEIEPIAAPQPDLESFDLLAEIAKLQSAAAPAAPWAGWDADAWAGEPGVQAEPQWVAEQPRPERLEPDWRRIARGFAERAGELGQAGLAWAGRIGASPLPSAWVGRRAWVRLAELTDRVRVYLRGHTERAAAVACAGLLAGSAFIGLGQAPSSAAPLVQEDALRPLASTIEVVSRRNMAELMSRSMTAQVAEAAMIGETGPEIQAISESNVGLILRWDVSELAAEPEAQLTLRRGVGDAPPQTPAEGVDVPLGRDPGSVVDKGLQPDTSYSYTLFIQRPGEKPEVLAQLVASTRRYPTELVPGDKLAAGDRLTSPSNNHYVTVEADGGIALLNNRNQKLWSLDSERADGVNLLLRRDGTLVVLAGEETIWVADASAPGVRLVLTDQGELQLLRADGAVAWSSEEQGYQLRGGDSPYMVSADGWTQPGAGPVSSGYGMRIHPIYGVLKLHAGVDMAGARGKPIYAAHDGVVERVYQDSGGNWTIEINHGEGISTRYLHMDGLGGILVKEGDEVVRGEQIALTGNSGQSTGPHLHFEVLIDGQATDPVEFLKEHSITIR
ncbi:MAG: M23 family metallopeptidase [Bifidobacteriaceae bacterium]|jgi:murein DD-endopeptidase MepM/ murein hydrolase activator NlpD|nr:M23 family metallopeptidase [Bifidobacteriaceae bacterium]